MKKNKYFQNFIKKHFNEEDIKNINSIIKNLQNETKTDTTYLISSERHNMAFNIFEKIARIEKTQKQDIRKKLDNLLMHPVLGYVFMVILLYITFWSIFSVAEIIEPLISSSFENIIDYFKIRIGESTFLFTLIKGFFEGFGGGLGIVVPYLFPFFILLSLFEDTGYLPRIAYLIDNLMHKIGLHGLSVIPLILGYGCSVPAVMATRILKSKRDRLITSILVTLVPCSARMIIILGLVGAIYSIQAAILIYIINIIIIGILGRILSKVYPEISPGLILEIPKYHRPRIKVLLKKTWIQLKEFVIIAWPLLIAGSIVMEMINHFNLDQYINGFLYPFTNIILGLPEVLGIVLLFGIMRKELALVLLTSAFGLSGISQIETVMNMSQIYTFTIFVTFYIPCIATIAALIKEFSTKKALLITFLTFIIAIILSLLIRVFFFVINLV